MMLYEWAETLIVVAVHKRKSAQRSRAIPVML